MPRSEYYEPALLPGEKEQPQIIIDAVELYDLLVRAEMMMTKVDRIRYGNRAVAQIQDVIKEFIPPAYTSQTCHKCGHIGIRHGKHFRCAHCGNVAGADVNAALNIATWGYVNTHERWEMLSCPIHDDFSTSKAHKSLVCG